MIWIRCDVCGTNRETCHCDGNHCEERGCDPDNKAMLAFAHDHEKCGSLTVLDSYGRETTFTAPGYQCMCKGTKWIRIDGSPDLRVRLGLGGDGPIKAVCQRCNQHGEFRHGLDEFARQSLYSNPEWCGGIREIDEALLEVERFRPGASEQYPAMMRAMQLAKWPSWIEDVRRRLDEFHRQVEAAGLEWRTPSIQNSFESWGALWPRRGLVSSLWHHSAAPVIRLSTPRTCATATRWSSTVSTWRRNRRNGSYPLRHRASAARLAFSLRCSGLIYSAAAIPPSAAISRRL